MQGKICFDASEEPPPTEALGCCMYHAYAVVRSSSHPLLYICIYIYNAICKHEGMRFATRKLGFLQREMVE